LRVHGESARHQIPRNPIDLTVVSSFPDDNMKATVKALICLIVTSISLAAGEVDMPRGFLTKKDYETAKKTAIAEKKPIAVGRANFFL
jgi:hypothetical protein